MRNQPPTPDQQPTADRPMYTTIKTVYDRTTWELGIRTSERFIAQAFEDEASALEAFQNHMLPCTIRLSLIRFDTDGYHAMPTAELIREWDNYDAYGDDEDA